MSARKLYFESVQLGDELPALAKSPIERVQLVRYAGASGDFNPVHVDETYARASGMPSVVAPGMLIMGYLGQLLTDWARGGQLRSYSVKFIKLCWPNDVVVCKGRVIERLGQAGRYLVGVELRAENQKGELVMKGQAHVQLFYSQEDESRQRAGQAPLVVEVPRQSLLEVSLPADVPLAPPLEGSRKVPAARKQSARRATLKPSGARRSPPKRRANPRA